MLKKTLWILFIVLNLGLPCAYCINDESSEKKNRAEELTFPNYTFSMELADADVRDVIRALAKESKLNIVTSDEVEGAITVNLYNVPFKQAFLSILKCAKLGYIIEDGVIRVDTLKALRKEKVAKLETEMKKREAQQKTKEAEEKARRAELLLKPLVTKTIHVFYADAEKLHKELKKNVEGILSLNEKGKPRGFIGFDEFSNTLIVRDIEENLKKIEDLVKQLDKKTAQISIESRIVEISVAFERESGIQWGGKYQKRDFITTGGVTHTKEEGDDVIEPQTGGLGLSGENFAVNLPAAVGTGRGGAIGFMIGEIGGDVLDIQLSALEDNGKGKVLAAPRVITQDNQLAVIKSGIEVPYETTIEQGTRQTEFKEAVLKLEVTPHVIKDQILLDVVVVKDDVDFTRLVLGEPSLTTKELTTKVLVDSGKTVVIGGLIKESKTEGTSGIPFFSKIPVLGWLFKHKGKREDKSELLIFITPTIMEPHKSNT